MTAHARIVKRAISFKRRCALCNQLKQLLDGDGKGFQVVPVSARGESEPGRMVCEVRRGAA